MKGLTKRENERIVEGLPCWTWYHPCYTGRLNGYAQFPSRPVKAACYGGILVYVPVHGGITYASQEDDGMVYGFDTGHVWSDDVPYTDPDWIMEQVAVMIRGIRLASELEDEYILAEGDNDKRAVLCQRIRDLQPGQDSLNMSLNILCGKL